MSEDAASKPNDRSADRPTADRGLAIFLLAVAGAAAFFARDIRESNVGSEFDPGPRFFPLILAGCLGIWAIVALVRSFVPVVRDDEEGKELTDTPKANGKSPGVWPPLLVMSGLAVYIPSISLIGFGLSTVVFATAMISWLDSRSREPGQTPSRPWPVRMLLALGVSVLLVIVVRVLFVLLFQVQLPTGLLGLPF